MAATNINSLPFGVESLGEVASNDYGTGSAADATNGNSTANNGSLCLFVLGTAADSIVVTRPEGGTETLTVAANHLHNFGPFEVDEYGPTLNYKAAAATTKIWPVQVEMLS